MIYRKGSSLHLADTLSRAPCQEDEATLSIPENFQAFRAHLSHLNPTLPSLSDATRGQLRRATESCQDMQLLKQYILRGWPPTKQHLPHQLHAF